MKNILAYVKTIDLRCGNCIYFGSSKCPFPDAEPYHKPCADGLLVTFFDRDVLIKQGKNTLLKPIRFLTSSKTKLEMMKTFDLDKNEVEEAILQIKLMFAERKKKKLKPEPKTKIETQTQEDIELEEKALKLLKEPNLLDKFLEYQNKWLVMDETTRKIELLTCVSAYGDYPLNLALQQVFSAGKTTTIVQTAKFFQDVWYLGGLSPKALIHQQGEYEEESKAYIINLEKKILIFMDEPAFETLQMLKPLLSHDKRRIEYRFVDKESGRTVTAILEGWPAVIFCSVKSKWTHEYTSRWLTASPQTSLAKIQKVIELKGAKGEQPEAFEEDEKFKIWRKAFSILKEKGIYKVRIPYARTLAKHFKATRPSHMRLFDLFLALIKASAILHAFQRQIDAQGYLIAQIEDYEIARAIFAEIEKPTIYGVGENVVELYEEILIPLSEDKDFITYEDIMATYYEKYETPISRSQLRDEYLRPLERIGLIDFEPHPTDRRKRIIIVHEKPIQATLIDDEGFKREIIARKGG